VTCAYSDDGDQHSDLGPIAILTQIRSPRAWDGFHRGRRLPLICLAWMTQRSEVNRQLSDRGTVIGDFSES
jgi:hypothetical protein